MYIVKDKWDYIGKAHLKVLNDQMTCSIHVCATRSRNDKQSDEVLQRCNTLVVTQNLQLVQILCTYRDELNYSIRYGGLAQSLQILNNISCLQENKINTVPSVHTITTTLPVNQLTLQHIMNMPSTCQ